MSQSKEPSVSSSPDINASFRATPSPPYEVARAWWDPFGCFTQDEVPDLTQDEIVIAVLKNTFPDITPPKQVTQDLRELASDILWANAKAFNIIDKLPQTPATPPGPSWLATTAARAVWKEAQDSYSWANLATRLKIQSIFKTPYEWVRQGGPYSEVRPDFSHLRGQGSVPKSIEAIASHKGKNPVDQSELESRPTLSAQEASLVFAQTFQETVEKNSLESTLVQSVTAALEVNPNLTPQEIEILASSAIENLLPEKTEPHQSINFEHSA